MLGFFWKENALMVYEYETPLSALDLPTKKTQTESSYSVPQGLSRHNTYRDSCLRVGTFIEENISRRG